MTLGELWKDLGKPPVFPALYFGVFVVVQSCGWPVFRACEIEGYPNRVWILWHDQPHFEKVLALRVIDEGMPPALPVDAKDVFAFTLHDIAKL